jgi:hypothetical protein
LASWASAPSRPPDGIELPGLGLDDVSWANAPSRPPDVGTFGIPAGSDEAGGHSEVAVSLAEEIGESPRKIGCGVTHAEAGMFSPENGSGGRKIGGCHAIAPARLAGMSDQ